MGPEVRFWVSAFIGGIGLTLVLIGTYERSIPLATVGVAIVAASAWWEFR